MRSMIRLLCCLTLCWLFGGNLLASQEPTTMPVSEIHPGMKGYGRTVFQGGKIERFEFEVLGLLNDVLAPGRKLILVRASGGPLADTGIVAGMSGSPCYIDNRLIGALSIGFPYEKAPIGGITPIGEMLEQLKEIPETPSSRTPLILPKVDSPRILKAALSGKMTPLTEIMGNLDSVPEGGEVLPLAVSGMASSPEIKSLWEGLPMRFMAGTGSAGTGHGEVSPLEPGGMVSINLLQGDWNYSASGTITYVSGKKLLLFGHQFMNLGPIDLPMWSSTVATVLPKFDSSEKLALPVAPVGALRLDRSVGVAGILGAEAKMVPLRIGLDLAGKKNLNFRFELMDNPFITPRLAATVLLQTLSSHLRGQGLQSLFLQGNIKVAGHPAIQLECMVADLSASRLAQYLGGLVQAVTLNPFERPVIEGISITVKAEERLDLTGIAGVRILKSRVKRGSVLPVLVTFQNIQGVRETSTFNIQVPAAARPGKATLLVGDGMSLVSADPDERAIDVNSMEDMVRLLNGALRNNHVYSLLVQSLPGAGLRGARIEGIPPTISSLLGSDGDGSNRLQRQIIGRAILPLEREVQGLASLELEIE